MLVKLIDLELKNKTSLINIVQRDIKGHFSSESSEESTAKFALTISRLHSIDFAKKSKAQVVNYQLIDRIASIRFSRGFVNENGQ